MRSWRKMEERRQYKKDETTDGKKKYKELKHEVGLQKLCRQAYNNYLFISLKKTAKGVLHH